MDAVASSDGFLKPTAARVVIGRRWAAMEGENCEDGVIFKGQRTEAEGLDRSRDIRIVEETSTPGKWKGRNGAHKVCRNIRAKY